LTRSEKLVQVGLRFFGKGKMIGSGIRLVVTRHHAEDFKREPQKQWRSHGKLNENGEKTEEEDFGNRIPGSQDC
jgi:hypothetical protein